MTYREFLMAGSVCALLCPVTAWAQNGLQLDVSGGVGAERNPFLRPGGDTDSAAVYVQLDPSYRISDEVSTLKLDASMRVEEYFRRYNRSAMARLGLDVTRQLSPATTLRGHAAGRTSRTSALDFFPVPGSVTPATPLPITVPDVTFAGTDSRNTQLEAGIGVDLEINPREQVSADLTTSLTRFSRANEADYRFAMATASFSRRLSEQTSIVASMRAGVSDYIKRSDGDGIILTPTLGIRTEWGPKLTLEASAGLTMTRVSRIGGDRFSHVDPFLRANLCQRAAYGSTCATASHESQPTALNGITSVTTVGASHNRRVNLRDDLGVYASYNITSRPSGSLAAASGADLLALTATYNREFDKRLAGFITSSYTRLSDTGSPRRSNPGVRIGLRYRFGGYG